MEELKKYKIITLLFLAIIFIEFGMIVDLVSFNKDLPKFELHRNWIIRNNTKNLYWAGTYSTDVNKIDVSLNETYLEETVIHEYTHYIYFKRFTNEMRSNWDKVLCNKNDSLITQSYMDKDYCTEDFARSLTNCIMFSDDCENKVYFDYVIKEYIGD